ncbi:MAG: spore germination protein, partial [Lachnospiraceae bacterium]|nr:spore germination protein [Lachnospiraceae bacterium]
MISASLEENVTCLDRRLAVGKSFDIVSRPLVIAGRKSRFYVVDGMCKDELLHKLLEFFLGLKEKELPKEPVEMARRFMPTVEMELENDVQKIEKNLLSGVFCLLIDGYDQCILIDARTYPARSFEEPEKDKALRGAKDCFVETVVFNTAMIRRRIRSSDLRMEMYTIGESSRTDVVISYMDSRVNRPLLDKVR